MSPPPPIGDGLARSLVVALGSDCGVAAMVARTALARRSGIIDLPSIGGGTLASKARVATDFSRRGWLTASNDGWSIGPNQIPAGVPTFLEGAAAMRATVPDDGRATAVVTMPLAPSAIARALPATGLAHAALVSTQETFERIADAAVSKFTIMTPFLNQQGLSLALEFFDRASAPAKCLIVRRSGQARAVVHASSDQLARRAIGVLDYTLPAAAGFETFHAKVVLADQDLAYVGSANMTVFARYSMELGVLMDGRAAKVIASVVRGIERIATPVNNL